MRPRTKLRITSALFWAVLLGAIALTVGKLHADEGHERDRDDGRDDGNECLLPEAGTSTAAVVGAAAVAVYAWHRRRGGAR